MRSLCCIPFFALFIPTGIAQDLNNLFAVEDPESFHVSSHTPTAFDSRAFDDGDVSVQLPGDTPFLSAPDEVDATGSVNEALLASSNAEGEDLAITSQDGLVDWPDGVSILGSGDIIPSSSFPDTLDATPDSYDSFGPVDTGHLIATGLLDHLTDPLIDLMSIFNEKCPPIREGEQLIPLCCTGGRSGQTVNGCRAYDMTNWNCYLRACQYCCKLLVSGQGVNCLKGFA